MGNDVKMDLLALMDRYHMNGRFISLDGHEVFIVEKGRGENLVLVHGFGASSFTWRYNIDFLSKHFRVVAFDLPGFGLSRCSGEFGFTMDEYVAFVATLLGTLKLNSVYLYGHSLGGTICMEYIRQHRSMVRALTVEGAPLMGEDQFSENALKNLLLFYFADKGLVDDDVIAVFQALNALADARLPPLPEILASADRSSSVDPDGDVPALILWGEGDKILTVDHMDKIRKQYQQAESCIVPHCGHAPHEERPELTNPMITRFLKTI